MVKFAPIRNECIPATRRKSHEINKNALWKGGGELASLFAALLVVCAANCLCAEEEFTLKSSLSDTDFDWSSGSSYEGDAAPSAAGAYVRIPNGMVAKLSAADTASWTFVTNKVARIRPMGKTSRLVVDVATANSPALLLCEVTYTGENSSANYDRGGMEKTGDGELRLPQCPAGRQDHPCRRLDTAMRE